MATTGDYTAAQVTNAVNAATTYVNPSWISTLDWSKISNAPVIPGITGTQNYIPFYSTSTTLGNSSIYQWDPNHLGINVAVPTQMLEVSGRIKSDLGFVFPAQSGYEWYIQNYSDTSGSYQIVNRQVANPNTWNAWFTISTGGNVGIGTTSAANTLDVAGLIRTTGIVAYPSSGVGLELGSSGTSFTTIQSYNRNTSVFFSGRIDANPLVLNSSSSGNVGIGTTNPPYKLSILSSNGLYGFHVDTNGTAPAGGAGIYEYLRLLGPNGYGPTMYVSVDGGSYSATRLQFTTLSNTPTNIDTMALVNGNVGIGTTSPIGILDITVVGGSPNNWVYINCDSSGSNPLSTRTTGLMMSYQSTSGNNDIYYGTTSGPNPRLNIGRWNGTTPSIDMIFSGGNVGLAMVPSTSFQLDLLLDAARKASTSTWSTGSDLRIKRNVRDLEGGLPIIMRLRPIEAEYNGLGNHPEGGRVVSLIAQEVREILPGTVTASKEKLHPNDKEDTEMLNFNLHEVLFHMLLAIKQISTKIDALERN